MNYARDSYGVPIEPVEVEPFEIDWRGNALLEDEEILFDTFKEVFIKPGDEVEYFDSLVDDDKKAVFEFLSPKIQQEALSLEKTQVFRRGI